MKKLLIGVLVAVGLLPLFAETPQEYLNRFNEYVCNSGCDPMACNDSVYNCYTQAYETQYKDSMTDAQREEYYRLKGQYDQQRLKAKGNNMVNAVDSTADVAAGAVRDKATSLAGRADTLGRNVGERVRKGAGNLVGRVDSVGNQVGEKVGDAVQEGVSYVKGLLGKKK